METVDPHEDLDALTPIDSITNVIKQGADPVELRAVLSRTNNELGLSNSAHLSPNPDTVTEVDEMLVAFSKRLAKEGSDELTFYLGDGSSRLAIIVSRLNTEKEQISIFLSKATDKVAAAWENLNI